MGIGGSKTMKSNNKKSMNDNNPSDPNAKKSKSVAFKRDSLMPTSMVTEFADNED
tara:strand:- start:297 stop:461 length:165 start_codon:yes stop_codon:yes gene_type:complete